MKDNPDLYAEFSSVVSEVGGMGYDTSTSKALDDSRKAASAKSYEIKSSPEYRTGAVNSNEAKKK